MNLRANRRVRRNEGNSALRVKGRKLLLLCTSRRSDGGLKLSAETIPPTHESYVLTYSLIRIIIVSPTYVSLQRITSFLFISFSIFLEETKKKKKENKRIYIYIYTRARVRNIKEMEGGLSR